MILTFDIGTTAVKASIFSDALSLVESASVEYKLITDAKLNVEFEADGYWQGMKSCISMLAARNPKAIAAIRGIGITTQGETLIPVDREGRSLRNAIVWLDGRAIKEAEDIRSVFDERTFYGRTGIPDCNGLCPLSKLLWIKKNERELYDRTYKFLLLEDYIILRLTGRYVTEKSILSTTGYFDIANDCLWAEALEKLGIDAGKIPEILECGSLVGSIRGEVAEELGLPSAVLVVTGAMDQTAGAVGAVNVEPGLMSETTGTALTLAVTTSSPDFSHPGRLCIYRHAFKGAYLYLPVCMTAGIVLKNFKDELCSDLVAEAEAAKRSVYDLMGEAAAAVPLGSGGLILLPYLAGLTQPDNNPAARGVLFGLGLDTKRGHLIRSIFEAVAYMVRENLEIVESITAQRIGSIRSLGGGSRSPFWSQVKADVTGRVINTMAESECASLGAAALVAVALGIFKSLPAAASASNSVSSVFKPDQARVALYNPLYRKYQKLYESVKDLFDSD
jgi:xylulokinase